MSAPLSSARYRLYFQVQLISQVGTWMQSIALNGATLNASRDLTSLAWLQIAECLPIILLSSFAAHLVDRWGPVRVLSFTTMAAFILGLLASLAGAHPELHQLYVLSSLFGLIASFDLPARQAFVYGLCPREEIPKAFALTSLQFHGARIMGPFLGTMVASRQGLHYCFFLNALSYLPLIYCLRWGYFEHARFSPKIKQVFHHGWKQTLNLVMKQKRDEQRVYHFLFMILSSYYINFFCLSVMPLLPATTLGRGLASLSGIAASSAWQRFGLIQSMISLGSLLGALFLWFQTKRRRSYERRVENWLVLEFPWRVLLLALIFLGLSFSIQSSGSEPSWNFLMILVGLGSLTVLCLGQNGAMLQLDAPQEFRARFSFLYSLGYFLFAPLGTLLYARLGATKSFPLLLAANAGFAFLFVGALLLRRKVRMEPSVSFNMLKRPLFSTLSRF